jgi:hypothetical protein
MASGTTTLPQHCATLSGAGPVTPATDQYNRRRVHLRFCWYRRPVGFDSFPLFWMMIGTSRLKRRISCCSPCSYPRPKVDSKTVRARKVYQCVVNAGEHVSPQLSFVQVLAGQLFIDS